MQIILVKHTCIISEGRKRCTSTIQAGAFSALIMTNIYLIEIVILLDKGVGLGCGRYQEQGGENIRWSYIESISRQASLIPNQKLFWQVINKDVCDK